MTNKNKAKQRMAQILFENDAFNLIFVVPQSDWGYDCFIHIFYFVLYQNKNRGKIKTKLK